MRWLAIAFQNAQRHESANLRTVNANIDRTEKRRQAFALQKVSVGWAERSESHQNSAALVGLAALGPPYDLVVT